MKLICVYRGGGRKGEREGEGWLACLLGCIDRAKKKKHSR